MTASYPYVSVANALRSRLDAGEWPPGARMPSLAELAQEYGVSKSTAARACRILADEGRLVSLAGYAYLVPEGGTPEQS